MVMCEEEIDGGGQMTDERTAFPATLPAADNLFTLSGRSSGSFSALDALTLSDIGPTLATAPCSSSFRECINWGQ